MRSQISSVSPSPGPSLAPPSLPGHRQPATLGSFPSPPMATKTQMLQSYHLATTVKKTHPEQQQRSAPCTGTGKFLLPLRQPHSSAPLENTFAEGSWEGHKQLPANSWQTLPRSPCRSCASPPPSWAF